MTNKEFIQNEIDNLKDMLKNAKDLNCESIIKCSKEEIKQYNQVLKDLEVLEILKKIIMITRNKSNGAYNGCYCLKLKPNTIPNEDFANKIKEWLDEG